MKILITGGEGFIGSSLYESLKKKHDVYTIDKVKSLNKKSFLCNITNKENLNNLTIKKIDVVIHTAAQTTVAKSFDNIDLDLKSNIIGTFNLLNWSKKQNVKKFIFTSTFNVYKEKNNKIYYKENDTCMPSSYYGISKLACENYIKVFCDENKINWNVLRIFNTYGSKQKYTDYHGMINIFLYMAKRSGTIKVKGKLDRCRDFIHIDDVVNIINKLLKANNNQVYNVGTGKKTSIKYLVAIISKILKTKIKIISDEKTKGDFLNCCANINKAKNDLKFKPQISLLKGLKKINYEINLNKKENFKF